MLTVQHLVRKICETTMLEENIACLSEGSEVSLTFKPFEIKALRVYY